MTRILLIRHGSTDFLNGKLCGRIPGIPLNAEGVSQAQALGERLRMRHQLAAIYSSPLERASETARILAGLQSPPRDINLDERLNEMNFGAWTGMPFDSLHSIPEWRSYNANRSLHSAPQGESLLEVQTRAWAALSEFRNRHGEATVAVVTHSDVIRSLLILLLGMPADFLLRLEILPASTSEVLLGVDYPIVTGVNTF